MKRAPWLLCCWLGLSCSASDPGAAASGGVGGVGGGAGVAGSAAGGAGGVAGSAAAGATSGNGGAAAGGSSIGGGTAGAGQATGGSASTAGSGGSVAGATGTAGAGGSGGGAGAGPGGCMPDAGGVLSTVGDTVHDSKTCLDWMKTTQTGVNYAAADTFCGDATTGGFDDWRIPTASEFASTITLCGKYPPDGPTDTKFFDQQGDGYWTSTPAGEPNKVCAIGMLDAGDYYHYGTAGPQVVRCVRGSGSVKMIKDCTMAMGCKTW